jgi:ribosomal protein L11 methyltransferase
MTMITAQDPAPAERQWLKITLLCPLPLLDSATDLMGVLSGAGVEQSPETESGALISGFFQLGEKTSDPHLQTESADNILARVEEQMTELFALYGCVPEKPAVTLLADQDWATCWQQYFKPFEIVPGLVIKPSWETYPHEPGQHVIEMDPGMAFGTGQHASTRMALALIKQSMAKTIPEQALDVGTGTGILAMAASFFGAGRVVAIDNDPDAVVVARENIAQNNLAGQIEVSGRPVEHFRESFQLVSANIVHDVLAEMASTLTRLTTPDGYLVLAGILRGEQEENIVKVYRDLAFHPLNRLYQDEWVSLLFIKRKT